MRRSKHKSSGDEGSEPSNRNNNTEGTRQERLRTSVAGRSRIDASENDDVKRGPTCQVSNRRGPVRKRKFINSDSDDGDHSGDESSSRTNGDSSEKQKRRAIPSVSNSKTKRCPVAQNIVAADVSAGAVTKHSEIGVKESVAASLESYKVVSRPQLQEAGLNFPQRLRKALDDTNNHKILRWLPHGLSFKVYEKEDFEKVVLPKYFQKKSKYWSFTRKLGRWGFIRTTSGPESGSYTHPYFQRNDPALVDKMVCQSNHIGSSSGGCSSNGSASPCQQLPNTESSASGLSSSFHIHPESKLKTKIILQDRKLSAPDDRHQLMTDQSLRAIGRHHADSVIRSSLDPSLSLSQHFQGFQNLCLGNSATLPLSINAASYEAGRTRTLQQTIFPNYSNDFLLRQELDISERAKMILFNQQMIRQQQEQRQRRHDDNQNMLMRLALLERLRSSSTTQSHYRSLVQCEQQNQQRQPQQLMRRDGHLETMSIGNAEEQEDTATPS